MDVETLKTVGAVLAALLGGTLLKAIFDYFIAKRTVRIDYGESIAKGFSDLNAQLKSELRDVRDELFVERQQRRSLEEQLLEQKHLMHEERRLRQSLEEELLDQRQELEKERELRRKLEARVESLERESDGSK